MNGVHFKAESQFKEYTKNQLISQRKHIRSLLQKPAGQCCF